MENVRRNSINKKQNGFEQLKNEKSSSLHRNRIMKERRKKEKERKGRKEITYISENSEHAQAQVISKAYTIPRVLHFPKHAVNKLPNNHIYPGLDSNF